MLLLLFLLLLVLFLAIHIITVNVGIVVGINHNLVRLGIDEAGHIFFYSESSASSSASTPFAASSPFCIIVVIALGMIVLIFVMSVIVVGVGVVLSLVLIWGVRGSGDILRIASLLLRDYHGPQSSGVLNLLLLQRSIVAFDLLWVNEALLVVALLSFGSVG